MSFQVIWNLFAQIISKTNELSKKKIFKKIHPLKNQILTPFSSKVFLSICPGLKRDQKLFLKTLFMHLITIYDFAPFSLEKLFFFENSFVFDIIWAKRFELIRFPIFRI